MKGGSYIICFILLLAIHSLVWSQGSASEAIHAVTEKIQVYPDDARLYIQRAGLNLDLEDIGAAATDLEAARQLKGTDLPAYKITNARLLYHAGAYADALHFVDQFLEDRHIHDGAFLLKARILERTGQEDAAISFYKKALVHAEHPSRNCYEELIKLLERTGRSAEASFYCQSAKRDYGPGVCMH